VNDERFIEANRTAQVIAVVLVAITLFAASEWLENLPMSDAEATRTWERFHVVGFGVSVAVAFLWSYYFGRIGFRALASGEFPPPGTLVMRRTKVRFGSLARVSGLLSIALAVMMWLLVALMAYAVYLIEYAT